MPPGMFFYAREKDKKQNKSNIIMMFRWVHKWVKQDKGATAVEFSLVAVPFIFLLIGTIEMSLMFAASANIHSATNDASRMIRTGQAQQSGSDAEDVFANKLCEGVRILLDCSKLQYEVIAMTNFDAFENYAASYDDDGNLETQGFNPGGSSDVVLIRVSYRYPLMLPVVGNALSDGPNMTKHLLATVVLQTEPYDINEEMENM